MPGVLFGLAVSAKASALLYCGLALFVCEAWRWKAIHRSLFAMTSVVAAAASRFYAESWALLRFLRTAATQELGERFHLWEIACRGGAIGAQAGKARERDTVPARQSFQKTFGADLPKIEKAFRAWLATL